MFEIDKSQYIKDLHNVLYKTYYLTQARLKELDKDCINVILESSKLRICYEEFKFLKALTNNEPAPFEPLVPYAEQDQLNLCRYLLRHVTLLGHFNNAIDEWCEANHGTDS